MGLRDRLEPGPELPRTPPFPAGNMFPVARGRQAVRGTPSQSAFLFPLESNTRLPVCPSLCRSIQFTPWLFSAPVACPGHECPTPVTAFHSSTSSDTRHSCAAPPGFAVLNDSESHQVLVDTTSTIFTSQISRAYPGAGVYLEPRGMAFLRLLESPSLSGGFISIHGDLTSPDLPSASSY